MCLETVLSNTKEAAMTELSDQATATSEQLVTDAGSQLTKANRYVFSLLAGTRNVLLDENAVCGK